MSSCLLRLMTVVAAMLFACLDAAANLDEFRAHIGELPLHLQFRDGEVSFVADYGAAQQGSVPVYIVIAMNVPATYRTAPFIVREALGDDGTWRRCDRYVPPFCSVGTDEKREMPADGFFKIILPLDSKSGERRPVRYREFPVSIRPGPVSNVGPAVNAARDLLRYSADKELTSPDVQESTK